MNHHHSTVLTGTSTANVLQSIVLVLLILSSVASCTRTGDLPPLPVVDTANMLPDISLQLTTLREAIEKRPSDATANGNYGLALATYHRDREASQVMARARALEPENSQWAYYHSFILHRLGQPQDAIEALNHALTQTPDNIDYLVKKGQLLYDLGAIDDAGQVLTTALNQRPRYPLAQFYLGRIHMIRQEWPLAIDRFRGLLTQGVHIEEVHFNLSQAYRRSGETALAQQHLKISEAGSTAEVDSYDPMYVILSDLNVGDQPHIVQATELYRRGRIGKAVEEMAKAHDKNPNNVGTHTHLVRMYGHHRNLDKALFHYQAAKQLDPDFNQLDANLAFAYQIAEQHSLAADAYTRAVALKPNSASLHKQLGISLEKAGQPTKAINHLKRSLALKPNDRDAQIRLGRLLNEQQQFSEAIQWLEKALEPTDQFTITALRYMSAAHAGLGNRAEAEKALQRGIAIANDYGNESLVGKLQEDLNAL